MDWSACEPDQLALFIGCKADLATCMHDLYPDLPALALLGIFGSATAPKAPIRTPDGNTITVSTGDPVRSGIIVSIADDRVVLARGSRTTTLRLPAP